MQDYDKRLKKVVKKRNKILQLMHEAKMHIPNRLNDQQIILSAYQQLGRPLPGRARFTLPSIHAFYDVVRRDIQSRKKKKRPNTSSDKIQKFYRSYEWRKTRYQAIVLNDGRCEACGLSKADGIVLHVDHIKPLRLNWDMRIDLDNLQVLCELCNHGKGNWDSTDWREPSIAVLMGERVNE